MADAASSAASCAFATGDHPSSSRAAHHRASPAAPALALAGHHQQASARLRGQVLAGWTPGTDFWVFAYASLIWRPGFDCPEHRPALLRGHHRALKMWSHVNRGTPECPGLVFALLPGGSCRGRVLRLPPDGIEQVFDGLWRREMATLTYQPRWLRCQTPQGDVRALAFTLPRHSPGYAGTLADDHYRRVFAQARGCYGTTLDYARRTHDSLQALGIRDHALAALLALAGEAPAEAGAPAPVPPFPGPAFR